MPRYIRHINDLLDQPDLPEIADRFWSKVGPLTSRGCRLWHASTDDNGYGIFTVGASSFKAHRVAWVLDKGPIPNMPSGRSYRVCHDCDRPICMATGHHFLGTDRDNVDDMLAKSRQIQGSAHYAAVLDEEAVRFIRRSTMRSADLARLYKANPGTIYSVRAGKTWKHVT